MDQEIEDVLKRHEVRIEDQEKRIQELEKYTKLKPIVNSTPQKDEAKKGYKGLVGGISLLIDNSFFNVPKTLNEVNAELAREGYHYPIPSINKTLTVGFVLNKKLLNRVKNAGSWTYAVRK